MSRLITDISEVRSKFSMLLEEVLKGKEVIIGKSGKPIARIVPYNKVTVERKPGTLKGKIKVAENFDELPSEILRRFGIDG